MLRTWVTEFRVRNGRDEAAEHGPRYKDGGRTKETGSGSALDFSRLTIVEVLLPSEFQFEII